MGDDHTVTLSPSTLQMLTDCPLRWLLERHGGTDGRDVRSAVGSLLHALVAESGKTESQMLNELEKVWSKLPFDSQWYSDNELERHRAMLSTFAQWRAQTRNELTEMGTEIDVDGTVSPGVRVRGRLDRLERDSAGRLVVVDIKTGKTPVSKDDAQRHAQLAMYQLAVAEGLLPQGDTPGGGRLVYLGKPERAAPPNASRTRRPPHAVRNGSSWCSKRRPPPRGRSSWRGSTTAVRTARCGPCARPRPPPVGAHDAALQPRRTRFCARPFRAHRGTGGGDRRATRTARRDRRRGRGQDGNDGGAGGVAGRQRLRPARRGARPDVHPQGRGPAVAPGSHPVGTAGRRRPRSRRL